MKYFAHILTLLLPFVGSAGFAQKGMTVFGKMAVAEHSAVGVMTEELTLADDVRGDGKLIMAGKDTQTIVAKTVTVSHLVIANPTVVNVKGKLTVRKFLEVQQGDLVVLPQAQLTVLPGALVSLATGSHLLGVDPEIRAEAGAVSLHPQWVVMGEALISRQFIAEKGVRFRPVLTPLPDPERRYQMPDLRPDFVPPRR